MAITCERAADVLGMAVSFNGCGRTTSDEMREAVSKAIEVLREKEKLNEVDKRLQRAISILQKEFIRAQACDFVRDPVAYALYHTWKKVEEEKK